MTFVERLLPRFYILHRKKPSEPVVEKSFKVITSLVDVLQSSFVSHGMKHTRKELAVSGTSHLGRYPGRNPPLARQARLVVGWPRPEPLKRSQQWREV